MATTTTRPAHVIKNDIRNVLDRMQIQYRDIRGGFECIHAPSIDLTSVQKDGPRTAGQSNRQESSMFSNDASAASTIRRGVVRKASKLSFATVRKKEKSKEHDHSSAAPPMTPASAVSPPVAVAKGDEKELPSRPSVSAAEPNGQDRGTGEARLASPSGGSSSFFNVPSPKKQANADTDAADEATNGTHAKDPSGGKGSSSPTKVAEASEPAENDVPVELEAASVAVPAEPLSSQEPVTPTKASSTTPTRDKFLPPIPKDFVQALPPPSPTPVAKTNVQQTAGDPFQNTGASELVVRFEIMIVKVRLEFKRSAIEAHCY